MSLRRRLCAAGQHLILDCHCSVLLSLLLLSPLLSLTVAGKNKKKKRKKERKTHQSFLKRTLGHKSPSSAGHFPYEGFIYIHRNSWLLPPISHSTYILGFWHRVLPSVEQNHCPSPPASWLPPAWVPPLSRASCCEEQQGAADIHWSSQLPVHCPSS